LAFRLSRNQYEIFTESIENSGSNRFNLPALQRLSDHIDIQRLSKAIDEAIQAHPGLRTRILHNDKGEIVQELDRDIRVNIVDISEEEFEKKKEELVRPFDLEKDPLARFEIYRTPKGNYFFMDFHHIVFDGGSFKILSRDIGAAYNGKKLSGETKTIKDIVEKEGCISQEAREESERYYASFLDGIEADSSPQRDVYSDTPEEGYRNVQFSLDEKVFRKLRGSVGVSRTAFFTSVMGYLMTRMTSMDSSFFISVHNDRTEETADTVAMMARTIPFYLNIASNPSVRDLVKQSYQQISGSYAHDAVPFIELTEKYGLSANIGFAYQQGLIDFHMIEGHDENPIRMLSKNSISPMSLIVEIGDVDPSKGQYKMLVSYRSDIYSAGMIEALCRSYVRLANEFLAKERLDEIDLMDPESVGMIGSFNETDSGKKITKAPIEMIMHWMKEMPDSVAAVFGDRKITFGELDRTTAAIAAYIHSKGIGAEDFVSILIPRCEYMVSASLGVLRSGAAYQPLDPSYPKERLNFMITDSGAKLLIADRSLRDLLDEYTGDVLYTDEIPALEPKECDISIRLDAPISILYTSGTTGKPKGCILENRNLSSFVSHCNYQVEVGPGSRWATYASYGFDASMFDMLASLCNGASLYIIPEEIRLDLMALDRFCIDNEITHAFMTTQVGRQFMSVTECKSLKYFMLGGEKLVPVKPAPWLKFLNLYGPTETTVYVLSYQVQDDNPLCPIGVPNRDTKAYVVDKNGRQLPVGMLGELVVAGPQVGRGYLNRPDKTTEVFIANPFTDDPKYSHAYRTGDVVRWLPDGNIEFVGRNDGQVKVRGFRIELTEVEKVIRDYPGIKDATVAAFDAPSGGKFVAAYVVSDSKVDIDSLNRFIAERKPPYMVPAVTMQIDRIPLNVNSKVDKRKLPKPEFRAEDLTPPENECQQRIFDIVKDIIGTDGFGIDTDLYVAGLTSITTIRLNVSLYREFGVDMQIKDLKENSTVRKLDALISSRGQAKVYERLPDYPLSKTQEGIFVQCVANPDTTMYNISLLFTISEELDIGRLREALYKAVMAHSFVRTRLFLNDAGDVRQRREDTEPFTVEDILVKEIEDISAEEAELIKPYSIIGDRLFRIAILEAKDERYLFIDMHHIIFDGTSLVNFVNSVEKAYAGEELEPEAFDGFDVVLAEQDARTEEAMAKAKEHFEKLLGGCETDILPRSDLYTKDHGLGSVKYKGAEIKGLEEYCDKAGVTVNGLMCSTLGLVLSKFCGTDDPVFTTVYNGRDDSRISDSVVMTVKTLPIICHVAGKTSDYIKGVSDQIMDSMSNSVMSFLEICNEYGIKSDILFVYQGAMFTFDSFCGKPANEILLNNDTVKSPITLMLSVIDGRLDYDCEYDKSRFSRGFMESFVEAFDKAVVELTKMSELADVDVMSDSARKIIDRFNETEVEQDLETSPVEMIESWMEKTPDSTAVVFKDVKKTYRELDDISARIAGYIQSKGIGKEDYVSVLVSRSEWIVLATIGILRSGAAYQPLDPSYPKERLNFMVKDSNAKLVIAERSLRDTLDEYDGPVLFTDEVKDLPNDVFKKVKRSPGDAFTILYTSGTTGTPKGCILEDSNLKSTLNHYTRNLEASSSMRTASYASYGFDANMMDLFTSLCNGGQVHIIPEDMRLDLTEVDRYFIENGITHSFLTTQMGRQFITMTQCKTLKHFLVGGEKLVPVNPAPWVDFVNIYGPTENTIFVTTYHVKDDNPLCPIGRPNDNVKLYVVDKNGHQLPMGAMGELYVAGPQVGRGYLNRPDKTSEVFIKNPFDSDPMYSHAYRTGDIARWLSDGNVECIGRNDGQVKVRGFRVELTEVEKVIREYPGITDATVAAFDSPSGGKFIAAYIVSDSKIDIDSLNSFIAERKPPYMVPAATMQIEKIPLNVNSKVDKRKLPVPSPESSRKEGKMPKNDTEKRLCEIYATVLGLEKVYADDDFFAIGGTSISASKLVLNCMNAGFSVVFKNIFDNPSPEKLAEFIGAHSQVEEKTDEECETVDEGPLSWNVASNLDGITTHSPRRVLLTGATGYLGSHVLFELLRRNAKHIYCLVRSGKGQSSEERLKTVFMYYFAGMIDESVLKKVTVIDSDITDSGLIDCVKDLDFDTIINCAASVKHFAADDSIEKVNYGGVLNLIDVAKAKDCTLVQISTESVAGESVNGSIPLGRKIHENELYFGQNLENKYVNSKFKAEKAIIDAIPGGLKGKILRAGNLMSRDMDGEFQINSATNAFMRQMKSYVKLGFFSVTDMDVSVEFSPIDMVAKAVVILAGTPPQFTVFHVNNCHKVHMANVLKVMRDNEMPVEVVSKRVFEQRFTEALKDETKAEYVSGLISYLGNAGETRYEIGADETYTVKALYRLGFSWPIITEQYIDKAFKALKAMRFFK